MHFKHLSEELVSKMHWLEFHFLPGARSLWAPVTEGTVWGLNGGSSRPWYLSASVTSAVWTAGQLPGPQPG